MAKIYYSDETDLSTINIDGVTLECSCSICGRTALCILDETEKENLKLRIEKNRDAGFLQDLFPNIPNWIRSGAIDEYSNGFCICEKCTGMT